MLISHAHSKKTQRERKINPTYREVNAGNTIHDDKDISISQLGETVVQANRKHEHQHLKIKVVGGPGGRLVL